MNPVMSYLHNFFFTVYPYICLAVFFMGSLARFDRDQYTWKSDSSQMLRARQLRWGSNLFHAGILFLFFGHLFGQLTPHSVYEIFMTASQKQVLAVVAGGIAGAVCFVGLSMLLHRRLFDPLPASLSHVSDPKTMIALASYLQGIATFRPDPSLIAGIQWHFIAHMLLGMTIFLLFPFSRLVHVWSGFASVAYLFRPYQVVRSRRLNVPAGQNQPGSAS
jgi:nitrate reductase gamma subunit